MTLGSCKVSGIALTKVQGLCQLNFSPSILRNSLASPFCKADALELSYTLYSKNPQTLAAKKVLYYNFTGN